jgi:hypothetical protein
MFCAPGIIFSGTEGVGSRFHVLRARTRFLQCGGHSCFGLLDSFSAVPRASGPVFMFYVATLVFDGTEGVGSRFYVLRARSHFRRYRGCQVRYYVKRSRTRFQRRRVLPVPFSCFVSLDTFSAVRRGSIPIFKFCAPGLVFGGIEGVGSCFHV